MVFSSSIFLFGFLPYVLAVYYVAPRSLRNTLLLAASLFFYYWGEKQYTWVLLASITGNYAAGLVLARAQIQRTPLLLLVSHSRALGEAFDFHGASRLAAEGVLRGLDIPYTVVTDRELAATLVRQAVTTVLGQKSAVALLVPPYLFAEA